MRRRSRQGTQHSRQGNPQSYRTGGFENTGTGYRYGDEQRRSESQRGGRENWSGQGQGWTGQWGPSGPEDWRNQGQSGYSEGRERGQGYQNEPRFGRGGYGRSGYEGPQGIGQQDWTQGRSGSYESDRGNWGGNEGWEQDRFRSGRGDDEGEGYRSSDYGEESRYGGYEPGDYSLSESQYGRGSFGGSRFGQGSGQGSWGMRGSQGYGQGSSQGPFQRRSQESFGRYSQGSFAGRGPQGYKRSDERITEDVNEMLTQDSDLDAGNISVEVQNGEVTLKGTVTDRSAKRRAEDIAESCSGVKEVQNQLRIQRDSESTESESKRDKGEKTDDKRGHRQQLAS